MRGERVSKIAITARPDPDAALIADRTSCAAASMFPARSNYSVIWLTPAALTEFIAVIPEICPK